MAKTLQQMRDKLEGYFDRLTQLADKEIISEYSESRVRATKFIEAAAEICTAISNADREIRLSKQPQRHIKTLDK